MIVSYVVPLIDEAEWMFQQDNASKSIQEWFKKKKKVDVLP